MHEQQLNIIESIRDSFWTEFPDMGVKLHRDFHHLNSSQAMCFNLFYPFVTTSEGIGWLQSALRIPGGPADTWAFEHEPCAEEKTNFDFYLDLGGRQCYFEIKLSELKFGDAKADARHVAKLEGIYAPRLRTIVRPEALEPDYFFANYQLLRNLSYLHDDVSDLFLVFPRANGALIPQVTDVLSKVDEAMRTRVHMVYLERLVPKSEKHAPLAMKQFAVKYRTS